MRYIYNQLVFSCSAEKKARTGLSIKFSESGGRIVCRAANKLRFGTLKLLIKAIVKKFANPLFAELESNILLGR